MKNSTTSWAGNSLGRLLASSDVGYLEISKDGLIQNANSIISSLLHQQPQDMTGTHLSDLLDRQQSEVENEIRSWFDGSFTKPRELACTFRTDDGRTIPTILCGQLRDSFDGEEPRDPILLLTVRDISASEYFHEMLKDGTLFNEVVDVLPVLRKDSHGRFTYANHLFCQESGIPPKQILEQTDSLLYPSELAKQYRDDDKRVLETGQYLETTEPHQPHKGDVLLEGLHRYVHVLKTRSMTPDNEPEVCVTYWKVADREQVLTDLLRAHTRHHQSLVANIPFFIYRKDADLRLSYVSDQYVAHLNEKRREAVLGKTDHDFFPTDQAMKYENDDRDVLNYNQVKDVIEPHTDPASGQVRYMRVVKTPLRKSTEDGKIVGLQGVFWDVTREQEAEAGWRRLVDEKDVLAREVHHRVKNDLWTASSLLALQSSQISDLDSRAVLQSCVERIEAMALIHEELYSSGELTHIELEAYIKKLIGQIRETLTAPQTREIAIEDDLQKVRVTMDEAIPCALTLNELVSNAAKHAFAPEHPDPKVTITLRTLEDGQVQLLIADNGRGLPENVSTDFSESFGLSLVHDLVKRHLQGSIDSLNKGGANFEIRFQPANLKSEAVIPFPVQSKEKM